MSEGGTQTVAADTYIDYVESGVEGINVPGKPSTPLKTDHLSSKAEVFSVTENRSRKTFGKQARFLAKKDRLTATIFASGKNSGRQKSWLPSYKYCS